MALPETPLEVAPPLDPVKTGTQGGAYTLGIFRRPVA